MCWVVVQFIKAWATSVYPGRPGQSQVEGERKSHAIEAYWWDRPDPSGRDVGGGGIVRSSTTKLIYRREKFSADFYRITDVENIWDSILSTTFHKISISIQISWSKDWIHCDRKSLKTPEAEDLHKYFEVFEETVAISLVFPSIKRQKT